jgi:hypothetical protein
LLSRRRDVDSADHEQPGARDDVTRSALPCPRRTVHTLGPTVQPHRQSTRAIRKL